MSITTADILRKLDLQHPRILAVFLRLVRAIAGAAKASQIEALIVQRRWADIPNALFLKPSTLSPLIEAIRQSLAEGGDIAASAIKRPGLGAVVQFDMRNSAVEHWVKLYGAEFVKEILDDQRAAISFAVSNGIAAGRNPRAIALDIIGRGPDRIGGILGLTEQQAQYVANMRAELESLSASYFDRIRRDKRFDSAVRKAISEDQPLSAAQIDKMVAEYADNLLQLRGETIARTEALTAFNAGRELAMQQAITDGTVSAQNVTKIWDTAHDPKVRESHRELAGSKVPLNGVFVTPSGARMKYPGDTSLGAGPEEVINCRCVARYKIDWLAQNLGP